MRVSFVERVDFIAWKEPSKNRNKRCLRWIKVSMKRVVRKESEEGTPTKYVNIMSCQSNKIVSTVM